MGAAREIDWATANVDGATLRVALVGEAPRGWQARFKAVAALLNQAPGRWADVSLTGGVLTVKGITEGVESDLRHFLESAVQQVNADLGLDAASEGDQEASEEQRQKTSDRQMSSRFRAFAEPPG